MIDFVLRFTLWVLTFVHPLFVAYQMCTRATPPTSQEVFNTTAALIFFWVAEVLDGLLLSHLIAARNLYYIVRIFFCLYLLHPRSQGATYLYNKLLKGVVEEYGDAVDSAVTDHLDEFRTTGAVQYLRKWVGLGARQVRSALASSANFVASSSLSEVASPRPKQ